MPDELPNRRSIRLRDYDYASNGMYFITICAYHQRHLFGVIQNGHMHCNVWGQIIIEEWHQTAALRPYVILDAFVVMPNHIHGIIWLDDTQNTSGTGRMHSTHTHTQHSPNTGAMQNGTGAMHCAHTPKVTPGSLGAVVRGFKGAVTRRINRLDNPPDHPVWHRNYYEHIIRNEHGLNNIRRYIAENPQRWQEDRFYGD